MRLGNWVVRGMALALWLTTAAWAADGPTEMLKRTTDDMIQVLKAEREAIRQRPQKLFELVEEVLAPNVDIDRMARWVLGKHWREATPAQQKRFTEEFENLLVRFYVSALLDDPGELDRLLEVADTLVTYMPAIALDDKRAQVRSEVRVPDGPMVPVTFSLLQDGGQWKIYDVNVDGISIVSNYRTSFASEIRRTSVTELIEHLSERNEELLRQAGRLQ